MIIRCHYEIATGRLLSVGTTWAADPGPGVGFVDYDLPQMPDLSNLMWDEAQLAFVARPAKILVDRFDDLINLPEYADFQTVWNGLSTNRKNTLRNVMIFLLGRRRYRAAGMGITLD